MNYKTTPTSCCGWARQWSTVVGGAMTWGKSHIQVKHWTLYSLVARGEFHDKVRGRLVWQADWRVHVPSYEVEQWR